MAGELVLDRNNVFARRLFRGLPGRYDLLAELLSFGQNRRWRRELVRNVSNGDPRTILDVATGTAGIAIAIARATGGNITGVDISDEMLAVGRDRIAAEKLEHRIHLETARAEALPFADASFDALSFSYLLRYVDDPEATMRELARVVRAGGMIASLDFFVPQPLPLKLAWRLYTRSALPIGGAILGGRAWFDVGRFLGPNIESHYQNWPLERITEAWRSAGIEDVRHRVMSLGGGVVMWGRRSG